MTGPLRPALAALALAFASPALAQQEPPGPVTPAEVAEAARQIQPQLPTRADDITTAVGIRAEGTEFIYDMRVSQALPDDRIEQIRQSLQDLNQSRLCQNPDIAPFVRRGGSMRHVYTDTAGHRFETRVAACP